MPEGKEPPASNQTEEPEGRDPQDVLQEWQEDEEIDQRIRGSVEKLEPSADIKRKLFNEIERLEQERQQKNKRPEKPQTPPGQPPQNPDQPPTTPPTPPTGQGPKGPQG